MILKYRDHPSLGFTRADLAKGGFANNVHQRKMIKKDDGKSTPDYKVFYMNLGKIFEDVVLRSMGKPDVKERFYPDPSNIKNYFYPDAIQDGSYLLFVVGTRTVTCVHKVFPNSVITEVKSTSNVQLNPSYNEAQITKMIDYLATVVNADGEKATDYAAASLHI